MQLDRPKTLDQMSREERSHRECESEHRKEKQRCLKQERTLAAYSILPPHPHICWLIITAIWTYTRQKCIQGNLDSNHHLSSAILKFRKTFHMSFSYFFNVNTAFNCIIDTVSSSPTGSFVLSLFKRALVISIAFDIILNHRCTLLTKLASQL